MHQSMQLVECYFKGMERVMNNLFGMVVEYLSGTEQRYGAPEREMLAIQYFVQYWRPYLWGTKFNVYTDHSPLRNIKTNKNCSRRLAGMILKLQEYDFDLHYTPGKENVVADALSRTPVVD